MMFTKGQDPKEAIKIGQKEHPITIINASYPIRADKAYPIKADTDSPQINWMAVGKHQLISFLSFLEKASNSEINRTYSISPSVIFNIIDEISMEKKEVHLDYLRGRIVHIEFESFFYKIPMNK